MEVFHNKKIVKHKNLGISSSVPCTTINKVCSSGLKSVVYGAMGIGLGISHVVVAGGFESMSNVPFYLTNVLL